MISVNVFKSAKLYNVFLKVAVKQIARLRRSSLPPYIVVCVIGAIPVLYGPSADATEPLKPTDGLGILKDALPAVAAAISCFNIFI